MSIEWTPVHQPDGVFCSPACGGKCKYEDYVRMVDEGAALAARMGEGWEAYINENLGWHLSIKNGCTRITVHRDWREPDKRSYMAWIEPGVTLRQHVMQFIESADTPEDALGFATQAARTAMSRIEAALAEVLK